jgi:hypothetical protein
MPEKEVPSRIDPLSPATRNTKRHLLLVGMVAITFKAFQVSIEKIPVAGLVINFDRGVFEFLLAAALMYLLATFLLYYYIDIRNFPPTYHEERTDEWKILKIKTFLYDWYNETENLIRAEATAPYRLFLDTGYVNELQKIVDPAADESFFKMLKIQGIVPPSAGPQIPGNLITVTGPGGGLQDADIRKDLGQKAQAIVDSRASEFPRYIRRKLLTLAPRLAIVRAAYISRNYLTDGLLPATVGMVALLSLYNFIDLHFLAHFVPHDQ